MSEKQKNMNIDSKYNPKTTEDKWYAYWMKNGFFHSEPDDRTPFTIVIPPPNVTGVLHMGHILNNTIQDVMTRRARMQGKNACWLPGTDHASIATEAKVVAKLKSEGINKTDLTREEFLKHAWEWTNKHGGIILEQLKKLGASCDWERTKFTMDEDLSESVIDVFIDLFKKGLIYRGVRMVNWDPKALTAISDEEVIYREVSSKLYYIRYKIEDGSDEWLTIATTRPETILGDTAVCVNPEDARYAHLKGKKVLIPLINRSVPIIQDEYVDKDFGTGALKITPAHDVNDYNIGLKHNLETIDIFNDNGSLNKNAQLYIGEDRFAVREKIVKELDLQGFLVKTEDYINKVGFSERTDSVIEPKLSLQWFCKMSEMAKPALDNVMNYNIRFHPAKFKNSYKHWMENVKDWCISRQLWWGQRIPAYFYGTHPNDYVVAKTIEDALILAKEKTNNQNLTIENLRQDEDVLDTWFSSWLWPISTFDGIRNPNNKDINYYYPTNDLITAPEILFFWVARMIMAGYEYRKELPFKNVYLTGIVRDKLHRKMSKSLGNSPDPLDLIEKYGADGIRMGMLLCSPAGNDLLFDESQCEQGRNFNNKLWNALRLIKGWPIDENLKQSEVNQISSQWFFSMMHESIDLIDDLFIQYKFSEVLMVIYKLIWDDFCSWYLEMIKPVYQQPIDRMTYDSVVQFYEILLKILHPFMPFITEEIWQLLNERKEGESIMISSWPDVERYDSDMISDFITVKIIIMSIRTIRKEKNILNKETIDLYIKINQTQDFNKFFDPIIAKLCNINKIEYVDAKVEGTISFIEKSTEFFIPLSETIDVAKEIKKLEGELKYTKGFLISVTKKLSNEKFVNNASEQVVGMERKKKADAESKIKVIEEQLLNLKK